jgi:hypothetical protein
LLSVAAATFFEIISAVPKIVSRLFGKLEAQRHLISGCDWAMAGAAIVVAAAPTPAVTRNWRRFIRFDSPGFATT